MSDNQDPSNGFLSYRVTKDDRADLVALVKMRFGTVSSDVMAAMASIDDVSAIDHLILVAANAAQWQDFIMALRQQQFRMIDQGSNSRSQIPWQTRGRDNSGQ